MAVGSQQYSVTSSTAVPIAVAPGDALPGGTPIASASVVISTTQTVLLGGSNVSTSNGLSLTNTASPLTVILYPGDTLYAIASSTTAAVSVLQT